VVDSEQLRSGLARWLAAARGKEREFSRRRHGVPPV
jgi:hypothetical protein